MRFFLVFSVVWFMGERFPEAKLETPMAIILAVSFSMCFIQDMMEIERGFKK